MIAGHERPQDPNPDGNTENLGQKEPTLRRRIELLEALFEQNVQDAPTTTERCRMLQHKVEGLERACGIAAPRADSYGASVSYNWAPNTFPISRTGNSGEVTPRFLSGQNPSMGPTVANRNSAPMPNFRSHVEGVGSLSSSISIIREHSPTARASSTTLSLHQPKLAPTPFKERPPCLRCRVLKKKCDSLELCSHCPQQSDENENDYWKVLGCYRGSLRDLCEIFCPEYSMSDQRAFQIPDGSHQTIKIVSPEHKSNPKLQVRLQNILQNHVEVSNLDDSIWYDSSRLNALSIAIREELESTDDVMAIDLNSTIDQINGSLLEELLGTTCKVLQVVSTCLKYSSETEYNFFTLLRLGNQYLGVDPYAWQLYRDARELLREVAEIYIHEHKIRELVLSGKIIPETRWLSDATLGYQGSWAMADGRLQNDLRNFLEKIESTCSSRGKLTAAPQVACFYALLVFAVTKSLLIDVYALRSGYDVEFNCEKEAVRITSAFRAIVSVFAWSSKYDLILENSQLSGDCETENLKAVRESTQLMVHKSAWERRGINTTKDFLIGLGSSFSPEGKYNSFFIQRVGLENLPRPIVKEETIPWGRSLNGIFTGDNHSTMEKIQRRISEQPQSLAIDDFEILQNQTVATQDTRSSSTETSWAHTLVEEKGLRYLFEPQKSLKRKSGRTGMLKPEAVQKAKEIRKIGACWYCRAVKRSCSPGQICKSCLSRSSKASPTTDPLCFRSRLSDLVKTLFPEISFYRPDKRAVETIEKEIAGTFKGKPELVDITWFSDKMPLKKFYVQRFETNPSAEIYPWMKNRLPTDLPLGSPPTLMDKPSMCVDFKAYLGAVLHAPFNMAQGTTGSISRRVHDIVTRFYHKSKFETRTLLQKALLINFTHIIMAGITWIKLPELAFSQDTVIAEKLVHTKSQDMSSRILDLQIKSVMHSIERELVYDVLNGLEKEIMNNRRTQSSWPVAFATTIILCLRVEDMQKAAQAVVINTGVSELDPERKLAEEACLALEDFLNILIRLFHDTVRLRKGLNQGKGFNLLSTTFSPDGPAWDDPAAEEMVQELRQFVSESYTELLSRDTEPDFKDWENFKERNAGRLVSRFLLPFHRNE